MPIDKEKIIDAIIGADDPQSRKLTFDPQVSTRKAFIWGALGLGAALLVRDALTSGPRNDQKAAELAEYQGEGKVAIENHQPLETRYFVTEIVGAASRTVPLAPELDGWGLLDGIFAGTALGSTLFHVKPEIYNRVIGAGAAVTARAIDDMSTFVAAAALNDARVKEYGLDAYFYETNSQLPADLTPQALLDSEIIETLRLIGITFAIPIIGKAYLAGVPFVVKNNLDAAQAIVNSLTLGDQVKAMIGEGKSGQDIQTYLNGIGRE